tara:strand:+ start:4405 stop:4581 length:177 start_codon:yes stop_codon:yes gene_type:complete
MNVYAQEFTLTTTFANDHQQACLTEPDPVKRLQHCQLIVKHTSATPNILTYQVAVRLA